MNISIKFLAVGLLLTLVLGGIYLVFAVFAVVLGSSLGTCATCLFLVWLVKTAIRIVIYPGSCWFWRRSMEASFCKELSKRLKSKVHELRDLLEEINTQPTYVSPLGYFSKAVISNLVENFEKIDQKKALTPYQTQLYYLLKELVFVLSRVEVQLTNGKMNLWDWLGCEDPSCHIDFEKNPNVKEAICICVRIEETLGLSCGKTNFFNKVRRWIFDTTLGNLEYMRADLLQRFNCEQVWVDVEGSSVDCLYVCSDKKSDSAIIYCNPNAGFYEFCYFQSEWVEFYIQQGVNVMLWNYRGYGRSKGKRSLSIYKKDAEALVSYLRRVKGVRKLGVHGESLGGSVACHIARTCGLDFLFADRTFTSLEDVALFNFGKVAYWGLRLFSKHESVVADDFLSVTCYKVLSADPMDMIIPDLSSLKSGVILGKIWRETSLNKLAYLRPLDHSHLLSSEELSEFLEALKFIAKNSFSKQKHSKKTDYYLVKSLDEIDEENISQVFLRINGVLERLDAGGKPLIEVVKTNFSRFSLAMWIGALDLWGSAPVSYSRETFESSAVSVYLLKQGIHTLQGALSLLQESNTQFVSSLKQSLNVIVNSLLKLLIHIENKTEYEHQTTGHLIPLNCGHCGGFSIQEKYSLRSHLLKSLMIS